MLDGGETDLGIKKRSKKPGRLGIPEVYSVGGGLW